MRFTKLAIFISAAIAAPLVEERAANGTESIVDVGPAEPPAPRPHVNYIYTSDTPLPQEISKREVEVTERSLSKRAITIDIWQDINRGGRHEGLITDINRCYNLGNGWNDAISSLQTPPNFGCYFYVDTNCPTNGAWLSVGKTSSFNFLNLPEWGYNDRISSYLCWT